MAQCASTISGFVSLGTSKMDRDADQTGTVRKPVMVAACCGLILACGAIVYNAVLGQDPSARLAGAGYVDVRQGKSSQPGARTSLSVVPGVMPPDDPAYDQDTGEVLQIQRALAASGRYRGRIDGRFGSRTRQAIIAYQRAYGLAVTGLPDAGLLNHIRYTRQIEKASRFTGSLSATVPGRRPLHPDDIATVQKTLLGLGFAPGPVDGALGRNTRIAIRRFQQANGLPVTGWVDDTLMQALQKAALFSAVAR